MKILIATDGSKYSRQAAEECCRLIASREKLNIKIVSAIEPLMPVAMEPYGVSSGYYLQVETDLRKQSQTALDETEKIVRDRLNEQDIDLETEILSGYPKYVIVDEAKKWNADLIVVGSHGYNFLERTLLGSVSSYVIHHSDCSVLIVRTDRENPETVR